MAQANSIPAFDFSCFSAEATPASCESVQKKREEIAEQLSKACEEIGFFQCVGDCVPEEIINKMLKQCRRFFALPKEEKLNLDANNSNLSRGYKSINTDQHTCARNESSLPDLKESFTVGPTGNSCPMDGPNQMPSAELIPGFEKTCSEYCDVALELCRKIGHALAMSLGLREDFFVSKLNSPAFQMVCLRYPTFATKDFNPGCGAHKDCGFLTLAVQEPNVPESIKGGLEVKMRNGSWVSANGCLVANIGSLLEFWTNGKYKSTLHRVSIQPQFRELVGETPSRYSIPFFCNCDYFAEVNINSINPTNYTSTKSNNAVFAGEYLQKRLNGMNMNMKSSPGSSRPVQKSFL